jgi:hypothetical protein
MTMDGVAGVATNDALQKAPGFKFDRSATKWVPDSVSPMKAQE